MTTKAVLLAQGNELTTGLTIDTNSGWLAGRLWELGIEVRRVITAPDVASDLREILAQAAHLAPIVISTGGLGPTRDDLTAAAAAAALGRPLALNPTALDQVRARFAAFGREMAAVNEKQAWLPTGSLVLENRWGTAPAFSVDTGAGAGSSSGCRFYFLPGVPREMRPIYDAHVLPDLLARHQIRAPITHTLRVLGVPESVLEEHLRAVELPGLEIGFRTKFPENHVKLRFSPDVMKTDRLAAVQQARDIIGWRAYGVDTGDLAAVVGDQLATRGDTLALAESCTAGGLAAWLASVPGASRYLLEGAVVYSNAAKVRTCGVSQQDLDTHGAVSEVVARQLARGIRQRASATWGIGITGIAGPTGGSPDKPVGTVHIALTGPSGDADHRCFRFPGSRDRVMSFAAASALAMLHKRVTALGSAQK